MEAREKPGPSHQLSPQLPFLVLSVILPSLSRIFYLTPPAPNLTAYLWPLCISAICLWTLYISAVYGLYVSQMSVYGLCVSQLSVYGLYISQLSVYGL